MKKIMLIGLLAVILMFPVASWSLTIGNPAVDIGGVDSLIASAQLGNSGDEGEVAWVNSVLGTAYTKTDMTKTDIVSNMWVVTNEDARIYAMDFVSSNPLYFSLKLEPVGMTCHIHIICTQTSRVSSMQLLTLIRLVMKLKTLGNSVTLVIFPAQPFPKRFL